MNQPPTHRDAAGSHGRKGIRALLCTNPTATTSSSSSTSGRKKSTRKSSSGCGSSSSSNGGSSSSGGRSKCSSGEERVEGWLSTWLWWAGVEAPLWAEMEG
eukprot:GHVT01073916.1.p4 GENE.GHVT01073916.1~~GHVT01073916.1.p4  ORF type:complete len:101 (+),score=24.00 GHVT01073916.1:192-494(+)